MKLNVIIIRAIDGKRLETVQDFRCLGSVMSSTEADVKARKALVLRACNKMETIWKSSLPPCLKHILLAATVESVLLYGCENWRLSKR